MFTWSLTSRYRRIVSAVWSGAAARLLSSLLTLVSLPLAVRYLGAERYGVWATITSTVVWINLLDLGIANTLTNHISHAFALDDKQLAARYFTSALALTAAVAAIAGTAFAFAFPRINWMALFNVSAGGGASEVKATVAAAALMLFGLPCDLAAKLLAGYQEVHRNNFAISAGAVASVAGLALGIVLRVSMPVLFVMSAGCLTLAGFATLLVTVAWAKPWLRPRACASRLQRCQGPAGLRLFVLPDSGGRRRGLQLRQPGGEPLPWERPKSRPTASPGGWLAWPRCCSRSSFRRFGPPTPKPTLGATTDGYGAPSHSP